MLEEAPLWPGPGFQPLHAGFYYAQRIITQPILRRAVAASVAAGVNFLHPPKELEAYTSTADMDCAKAMESLRHNGYAKLPDILSPLQISEMKEFLAKENVVLRNGAHVRADQIPAGATLADFSLETVLRCPHVLALANTPIIIHMAVDYLGCLPTISTIGIRWSLPGAKEESTTQAFHRDPDDWRFFKLFVYMTDVDEESGPHLYVPRSHLRAGSLHARCFEQTEIEDTYGKSSIIAVTGSAGTTFIADTYGIHAGPIPKSKTRLMLEVGYSVLPVFAFRYKPLHIEPRPRVDRYINRLLLDSVVENGVTPM
jgi:hypothetical protein